MKRIALSFEVRGIMFYFLSMSICCCLFVKNVCYAHSFAREVRLYSTVHLYYKVAHVFQSRKTRGTTLRTQNFLKSSFCLDLTCKGVYYLKLIHLLSIVKFTIFYRRPWRNGLCSSLYFPLVSLNDNKTKTDFGLECKYRHTFYVCTPFSLPCFSIFSILHCKSKVIAELLCLFATTFCACLFPHEHNCTVQILRYK